jgi:hypothetical protein
MDRKNSRSFNAKVREIRAEIRNFWRTLITIFTYDHQALEWNLHSPQLSAPKNEIFSLKISGLASGSGRLFQVSK